MKTLDDLCKKYYDCEKRHGVDAPVAFLRWLRRADNSLDERCQLLADAVEKMLVKRCINVFEARTDDSVAQILAYQQCADQVRNLLHKARLWNASFQPED